MERETRVRQQENNAGQQQPEFAMRRNPLHAQSTSNGGTTANELSSNTVDPFLSAAASAAATAAAVAHVNGTGNGAATNIPQPSTAPPSSLATDFHARQESADSGLGMGGSYSLPHTPEDFLASMDDTMDTTLDCNFLLFCSPTSYNNSLIITGPASVGTVDMNDMNGGLEAGGLPAHMDTTDDIVPTLDVR